MGVQLEAISFSLERVPVEGRESHAAKELKLGELFVFLICSLKGRLIHLTLIEADKWHKSRKIHTDRKRVVNLSPFPNAIPLYQQAHAEEATTLKCNFPSARQAMSSTH